MEKKDNNTCLLPPSPVVIQSEWYWGTSIHIVTADGKALVKMVMDKDIKDECEIFDLNTHHSCRKKGYATMLMQEVENIAHKRNVKRLYLWAERGSWMEKWYRRMEYETEEFREPPKKDTLWMVKFLSLPDDCSSPNQKKK